MEMQRRLTIRIPITALMFRCANANGVIILSTLNYGADMGSNLRMAKWQWMASWGSNMPRIVAV